MINICRFHLYGICRRFTVTPPANNRAEKIKTLKQTWVANHGHNEIQLKAKQ